MGWVIAHAKGALSLDGRPLSSSFCLLTHAPHSQLHLLKGVLSRPTEQHRILEREKANLLQGLFSLLLIQRPSILLLFEIQEGFNLDRTAKYLGLVVLIRFDLLLLDPFVPFSVLSTEEILRQHREQLLERDLGLLKFAADLLGCWRKSFA